MTWLEEQRVKFEREILLSRLEDLRKNPYAEAAQELDLAPDHPKALKRGKALVTKWVEANKTSAYIFGDTYEGMPIDDALKVIMEVGFGPSTTLPNGAIRFMHDYLPLGLVPRMTEDGKLLTIALDIALPVCAAYIERHGLGGLGLLDPQIVDGHLYAQMDATGGLRVKIFALRQMAKTQVNTK